LALHLEHNANMRTATERPRQSFNALSDALDLLFVRYQKYGPSGDRGTPVHTK
jgi:hypothetical protein